MIYTKRDKRSAPERQAITNFFKPLTMSIWNQPEFQAQAPDNSNSKYLNKRLGDGDSITLKFSNVFRKVQPEGVDAQYKSKDGYEFFFYFDFDGKELEIKQKDTNGFFFKAMREADIQPEEVVTITRNGLNTDTQWTITREGEAAPVAKDEQAF